ncbi:hypothetical protein PF005_g28018 [Phytophthora fragariae]|uniref:Uncharacterized protein n=1 Tax=Phytophthora fragariae TaxID=53985 RepID=A0A6A4B7V5_9STRA|nr:hypothetical protein PF003_g9149 [Phytophthora fragariae]KAE8921126.1 hypothetical protein PF009_g28588 [Phytophthora fragariae]KAE8969202.1 hypothetical protein PF011_g26893 [Phytophthora fragariae]KAE9066561.1 hypothetical protein PF007_g28400 [Phytophthora fragariae]KAE9067195.1 hypothetical protein PF010_g27562 [Phytophthora fragariae]
MCSPATTSAILGGMVFVMAASTDEFTPAVFSVVAFAPAFATLEFFALERPSPVWWCICLWLPCQALSNSSSVTAAENLGSIPDDVVVGFD